MSSEKNILKQIEFTEEYERKITSQFSLPITPSSSQITRKSLIKFNEKPIRDKQYLSNKIIGKGAYGTVFKASLRANSKIERAVKRIQKSLVENLDILKKEIKITIELDHPNVIKLIEMYEDDQQIYLVLDYCSGGELFDRIIEVGKFSENEAANLFKSMTEAVNYLHLNNVVHRDIKPENFMFYNKTKNSELKLIDFGVSKNLIVEKCRASVPRFNTITGTDQYMAPEVIKGSQNEKCDIWSLGVILQTLLCGYPPFQGETEDEIFKEIVEYDVQFNEEEWNNVSDDAKDLLLKIFVQDFDNRYSAEDILNHKWLKKINYPKSKLNINYNRLKKYAKQNKIKKAALTFMALQSTDDETSDIRLLFKQIDKNKDGFITIDELVDAIQENEQQNYKKTINLNSINILLEQLDTDGNGKIDQTEFLASLLRTEYQTKECNLKRSFDMFDLDNSGTITIDEIKYLFGGDSCELNNEELLEIFNEVDKDKNGEIDYGEFKQLMKFSTN